LQRLAISLNEALSITALESYTSLHNVTYSALIASIMFHISRYPGLIHKDLLPEAEKKKDLKNPESILTKEKSKDISNCWKPAPSIMQSLHS